MARCGFSGDRALSAIELGSYEGRSANWLLDNVLNHEESSLHCVDVFDKKDEPDSYFSRFKHNVLDRVDGKKVTAHATKSGEFLLQYLQTGKKADIIYIDASHRSPEVLTDIVLSFKALKVGGLMICDDYLGGAGSSADITLNSPKFAIDCFTTIFRPQIEIIVGQPLYQLAFIKTVDYDDDDAASRGDA